MSAISITPVCSQEDLRDTIGLFRAYVAWLDLDLTFQDFDSELASLPGKYAPPTGELFLARLQGAPVGCVAVRPLSQGVCEMKRLYVVDAAKGKGLGKQLAIRAINTARELGYVEMRLDTLPKMHAAVGMYRSLGFVATQPYYATPLEDTLFLSLDLRK